MGVVELVLCWGCRGAVVGCCCEVLLLLLQVVVVGE